MAELQQKSTHLMPSELGTKEYWDSLYTLEITNHTQDPNDVGTIWFDDCSAEDKVVAFLEESELGLDKGKSSFLDLGTGNGHLLFRLREGEDDEDEDEDEQDDAAEKSAGGWRGRMMGVDYSSQSIEFAKRIATDKRFGKGDDEYVEFVHWDIITASPEPILQGPNVNGWDVVLDKGTFDAISLSEEKDAQDRRICEGYKERVVPLIRQNGLFLVTSCNWTEEELRGWFEGGVLQYVDSVKYKSFSFGGKKGQSISSVCFRKVGF